MHFILFFIWFFFFFIQMRKKGVFFLIQNDLYFSNKDYPEFWQKMFQSPATPVAEGIMNLHNDVSSLLVLIAVFVSWFMIHLIYNFSGSRVFQKYFIIIDWAMGNIKNFIVFVPALQLEKLEPKRFSQFFNINGRRFLYINPKEKHSHFLIMILEIVWTFIPGFCLILIAAPSFALIYALDELVDPQVTIKAIGHQWYWTYEINDVNEKNKGVGGFTFDSRMADIFDLDLFPKQDGIRLLEVDQSLKLPIKTHIRLLITATDVIHSWAVPSLGVKMDAIPGRLNETNVFLKREGVFYGQCSELCGSNHGFMPIKVEGVSRNEFLKWILRQDLSQK